METVKAENVFEAAMYAEKGYMLLAGQTYIETLGELPECAGFVDIAGLSGMNTIEQYDGCLCIGAAVTMEYLGEYLAFDFTCEFNDLCKAAYGEGEARIKRATLGGCIAVGDGSSAVIEALLAHDAKIELMGRGGIRMVSLSSVLEDGKRELGGSVITAAILYRTKKMEL